MQTAITAVEHGEVEIWTGLVSKEGIPEDKVGWCRNEGCEDQFEWLRRGPGGEREEGAPFEYVEAGMLMGASDNVSVLLLFVPLPLF